MSNLKSRKKLCEAMVECGFLPAGTDYRKLDNEVYGRDTGTSRY